MLLVGGYVMGDMVFLCSYVTFSILGLIRPVVLMYLANRISTSGVIQGPVSFLDLARVVGGDM